MKFDCWVIGFGRDDWSIIPFQIDYFEVPRAKHKKYCSIRVPYDEHRLCSLGITLFNVVLDFEWRSEKR